MQWRDDTTLPSRGLGLRPIGKSSEAFELPWLKTAKAQNEQIFFGLPPKADLPPDLRAPPAASSWRPPPSRPRASRHSRALVCGLRDARTRASTSTAGLPARQWPRLMPRALTARASALAAWGRKARSPRGRAPATARRPRLPAPTPGTR